MEEDEEDVGEEEEEEEEEGEGRCFHGKKMGSLHLHAECCSHCYL